MPRSYEPELRSTKQAWRLFQADTKAAQRRRKKYDRMFLKDFPEGHNSSIKGLVMQCAREPDLASRYPDFCRHIGSFHPDSFNFIAEYGMDYRPEMPEQLRKCMYESTLQPGMGECFRNTQLFLEGMNLNKGTEASSFLYVEGMAFGIHVNPMLHAWNSPAGSSTVFDWTFYPSVEWTRYFGIGFTQEEYDWIKKSIGTDDYTISLFRRERFAETKPFILEVLKDRQEKPAA